MSPQSNPTILLEEAQVRRESNDLASPLGEVQPERASGFPAGPPAEDARHLLPRTAAWAGDHLIRMGRSVRILAVTVIVLLSGGLGVLVYGQLKESAAVASVLGTSNDLLRGFGLLMILTIGYLIAKSWTTSRDQRRLFHQLLEEEATERALRLNPITQFHHPEVCRDILLQQASHAARLHAPLSLLELTFPDLGSQPLNHDMQLFINELVRQLRRICRSTDSLLRWTPDSFLLVLPEVSREELLTVSHRIRQELERWLQDRLGEGNVPTLRWRGITSRNLDASGDILLAAQRLLENESRVVVPRTDGGARRPREKSIGLALELEVHGLDSKENPFRDRVVTERVAADRIWFVCKRNLVEGCSLTVVGPEGSFEEEAVLVGYCDRGRDQLAEVQFVKAPENWVVRV